MAADYLVPWLNASGQGGLRSSMIVAPGDGSTVMYTINFAGGYVSKSDIKAYTFNTATGLTTPLTVTAAMWTGPNQITLTSPVPVGQYIVIYRDTPKTQPLVSFTNGAIMNEPNLDLMADQAIFVAAEMADRFDLLNDGSSLAISSSAQALAQSRAALDSSAAATATANAASGKSDGAIATANSAAGNAATALSTANTAKATADAIDGKASSALTNAQAAVDTANGINAKAQSALDTANAAKGLVDTANTNASTAITKANAVSDKADAAVTTANSASSTASTALQKTGGDVTGTLISTTSDQYRIISGNYGTYWRFDGSNLYLMSTNQGDTRGSYSDKRPFVYNPSTGNVSLAGGAQSLTNSCGTFINYSGSALSQILLNASGYQPAIRSNSSNYKIEFVNGANNAVNAEVRDGGDFYARGALIAGDRVYGGGGSSQMASDGNIYGTIWGGWLGDWLGNQFAAKVPIQGGANYGYIRGDGPHYINLAWGGQNGLDSYVDGGYQGTLLSTNNYTTWAAPIRGQCTHSEERHYFGIVSNNLHLPNPWCVDGLEDPGNGQFGQIRVYGCWFRNNP